MTSGHPHTNCECPAPEVTLPAVSASNVRIGWFDDTKQYALHWDGSKWHTVTAPFYANPLVRKRASPGGQYVHAPAGALRNR